MKINLRLPQSLRLSWRNVRVNMDPGSLVILIGIPAMYMLFMGTMFISIVPSFQVNGALYSYTSYLAPGIMAFQTVMAGSIGGSILWIDRRLNMFTQILSGPFTRIQYLIGIMIATTAVSLAGALFMVALSLPLGSIFYFTPAGFAIVLLNLVIGSIFFCALMLSIAARVRSNNIYNSIQILIIFIANFASDVFYPLNNTTPLVLRVLSVANPRTYVADGVRAGLGPSGLLFSTWSPIETVVLALETTAMFVLAYRIYSRIRSAGP